MLLLVIIRADSYGWSTENENKECVWRTLSLQVGLLSCVSSAGTTI